MFPIGDAQGRIIAFGGRALDPDAKAKYLNSPDTPLFHKGRNLYRLKEGARAAVENQTRRVRRRRRLCRRDRVRACGHRRCGAAGHGADRGSARADLARGRRTDLLFRRRRRGQARRRSRARSRAAADGAGQDAGCRDDAGGAGPDDLYRSAGAPALHAVLAEARPAVEALFEREQAREPLDTPERKSAFKKRLREAAFRITDEETKKLYLSDLMAGRTRRCARRAPKAAAHLAARPIRAVRRASS